MSKPSFAKITWDVRLAEVVDHGAPRWPTPGSIPLLRGAFRPFRNQRADDQIVNTLPGRGLD